MKDQLEAANPEPVIEEVVRDVISCDLVNSDKVEKKKQFSSTGLFVNCVIC